MTHLKQKIQIQADFFVIWEFTIFLPRIFACDFLPEHYDFPQLFFRSHLNFSTKPYFAMLL